MNIEKLNWIIAIVEQKEVQKAAKKLNVSSEDMRLFFESISRQEGAEKFLETSAYIDKFLSPEGHELYRKAKKIMDEVDSFEQWANDLSKNPAGYITIVAAPFFGAEILLPLLGTFLEKYPDVRIKLSNSNFGP